ncbi:hypothetical protein PQX77_020280, partial [Marasmius sp. AFHP31]
ACPRKDLLTRQPAWLIHVLRFTGFVTLHVHPFLSPAVLCTATNTLHFTRRVLLVAIQGHVRFVTGQHVNRMMQLDGETGRTTELDGSDNGENTVGDED